MRGIITILCLFFFCSAQSQQDILYTQFMFNKLGFNPAYAGHEENTTFNFIHRDQWAGFPGAPQAQFLSVNFPIFQKRTGIGFHMQRESISIHERLTFTGNYSYSFKLGNGNLSMGMSISGRRLTTDFSDPSLVSIVSVNQDPSITGVKFSKNILNFGTGFYYRSKTYYLGVSVPRLMQSGIDLETDGELGREARHLYAMLGAAFPVSEKINFTPQVLFKMSENTPIDLDVNFGFDYEQKYFGALNVRLGGNTGSLAESLDFVFGFQLSNQLMLGFSYDYTLSDIGNFQNGSFEVLLNYRLIKTIKKADISNPRFF